jgi:hypothetical protein
LTYISAAAARSANSAAMEWQVHYQSGGRRFSAPAVDRSTATAIACILIRDGHEIVTLVSKAGETIEPEEIKRLCRG